MNKPKSILKYRPETNIRYYMTSPVLDKPQQSSWLSRLQSKIYSQQPQEEVECESPLLILKQDLKRVTFSLDNFITEHPFSYNDSPLDENYQKQKKQNTITRQPIDLYSYYENACIQREEACVDRFRSILKNIKTSHGNSINLSKQPINSSQASPISDVLMLNFGLTSLNLSNCKLDDEAIRILLCSLLVGNTIEHLKLCNNNFKSKGYKYIAIFLKSSKTIKTIDLSESLIEKKGMEYLTQGLRYTKTLTKFVINDCVFKPTIEALDVFSEGVYSSNTLESLSFCYNFPTLLNQELWLANIIRSPIVTLDLSGNNLGSVLSAFNVTLKENTTLQHLFLSNCKISSEGLAILSNALLENNSLETLDLSRNPLCVDSDDGILSLKAALSRNSSINDLNLSETQLDSTAVIALAEALPENYSLTRLDLSKNPHIDTAGVLALSISIKMNRTLTFLDINIPPSDEDLANLQNDIVAVCTTNMLKKVEAQKRLEEEQMDDTSLSSSSSSTTNSSIEHIVELPTEENFMTKHLLDESESSRLDSTLHETNTSPVITSPIGNP